MHCDTLTINTDSNSAFHILKLRRVHVEAATFECKYIFKEYFEKKS